MILRTKHSYQNKIEVYSIELNCYFSKSLMSVFDKLAS